MLLRVRVSGYPPKTILLGSHIPSKRPNILQIIYNNYNPRGPKCDINYYKDLYKTILLGSHIHSKMLNIL
jgi:hypothetical protein